MSRSNSSSPRPSPLRSTSSSPGPPPLRSTSSSPDNVLPRRDQLLNLVSVDETGIRPHTAHHFQLLDITCLHREPPLPTRSSALATMTTTGAAPLPPFIIISNGNASHMSGNRSGAIAVWRALVWRFLLLSQSSVGRAA
eukprot:539584-Rhodomonas_salina.3